MKYLSILGVSTSKTLKLNFHEGCLSSDASLCSKTQGGNTEYLNKFSDSDKKECLNYEQVTGTMNDVLQFCVDMGTSSWFGGPERTFQYWPLNKFNWTDESYITREEQSQAVSNTYISIYITVIELFLVIKSI